MLLEPSTLGVIASPRRREILRLVWDRELAAGDIHRAMPDVNGARRACEFSSAANSSPSRK